MTEDKIEVYSKEIAPKVQEIRRLCNENKIPYFATFGVALDDNGMYDRDGMVSSALLPETLGISTNDHKFARFINVLNGFQTVLRVADTVSVDSDPCDDLFPDEA